MGTNSQILFMEFMNFWTRKSEELHDRLNNNQLLNEHLYHGPDSKRFTSDADTASNEVQKVWVRKNTRVYPKVSGLAAWSENCNCH
jgi:hypothetical protein